MIIYERLWETMRRKGITTYQLRENYNIDSRTIRRLKDNENVTVQTLDKLCNILQCRLEDVAEHLPEKE
ncbi:MAG TPA: helix-turn-helix transcriptional regulator [Firmicutes bacterium]|nr:helix-turn-helix transcriptional regulator [Bacillota bacterium]